MIARESLLKRLENLDESQLQQATQFIDFLQFKARHAIHIDDEDKVSALYAEFASEDQALAAEGMSDYAASLEHEDKA